MAEKFEIINGRHQYSEYICVDWDDHKISKGYNLLGTYWVSVCLAVTLYDPKTKKGALAHITEVAPDELQPENVIDTLLKELMNGAKIDDYQRLEATLVGEGKIRDGERAKAPIVREKLRCHGIPIIMEDLSRGPVREVFLCCDSGRVEVYQERRDC